MFVFHFLNGAELFVNILTIFKLLLALSFGVLIIKIVAKKKDPTLFKLLNNYSLLIFSFLFPLIVFFSRWILISGSFVFVKSFFVFFIALWVFFWISLRAMFFFVPKKLTAEKIMSILLAAIPLILIPSSATISNEIQYSLSAVTNLSVHKLSISALILLSVIAFVIFVFNKSRNLNFNFAKYIYFPIVIGTITLFTTHNNFIDMNLLDTFHHGENLISTQQLFDFAKIPFINIYPTHGISYLLSQTLYSLVNGYQNFAPWLWEFIPKVCEVILLYFVLTKITNSFFSAMSIIFLPLIGTFGGQALIYGYSRLLPTTYYFASFFVGLVLIWSIKRMNFKALFVLWISCLFLTAWRVDFGIAGFAASGFIVFTTILARYHKALEILSKVRTLVSSLILTSIVGLTSLFILSLIGKESLLSILAQILEFVRFQGQAQGLPQVIGSYSPISIFQYFILPSVAIFYILFYVNTVFMKKTHNISQRKIILVYLAIFSIIISIRSLQRQTLAILGYNPYLFAFLLLCIPIYLEKTKSPRTRVLFLMGLLAYQFVLPNNAMLIKAGQQVTLYNWHSKESRVHINDSQFKDLVVFFNSNLDKDQTFLDLTSSPLLYVVSERRFINYFIPTAYDTSEIVQTAALEKISKSYDKGEIPIVIFRQPYAEANKIDGVPNEIRSYRIYEYIYRNYHPAGNIDGYMIWTQNAFKLHDTSNLTPINIFSQNFDLLKLPYIWGRYDPMRAYDKTSSEQNLIKQKTTVTRGKTLKIETDHNIDKSTGNYLAFTITSGVESNVTISYGPKNMTTISFMTVASIQPVNYLIRISSQYLWLKENTDSISISSDNPIEIVSADIRKGD